LIKKEVIDIMFPFINTKKQKIISVGLILVGLLSVIVFELIRYENSIKVFIAILGIILFSFGVVYFVDANSTIIKMVDISDKIRKTRYGKKKI
jgi:predicted membrane channel-forming protein YqfA (hemolysin III family)